MWPLMRGLHAVAALRVTWKAVVHLRNLVRSSTRIFDPRGGAHHKRYSEATSKLLSGSFMSNFAV